MKKILIQFMIITALLITNLTVAHAYQIDPSLKPDNQPSFGVESVESGEDAATSANLILQIIAGGLLFFAAPVAIIMISLNGFTIVTGGADSEKIEQAKKDLTWSVIGLLLIILSYSIVRIIISLLIKGAEGTL